jgi:hypothetical protein
MSPMIMSPTFLRPGAQRGSATVEFALVAVVYFLFVFGAMELARMMYTLNTLTEVVNRTARGAAVTNPGDAGRMNTMRATAMLDSGNGRLPLGGGIDTSYLRIEYLAADRSTAVAGLPQCPVNNVMNCLQNPNGTSCIRYIRVRLCHPPGPGDPSSDTTCKPVSYAPMLALGGLAAFNFQLPAFTTVVTAQTLGAADACAL